MQMLLFIVRRRSSQAFDRSTNQQIDSDPANYFRLLDFHKAQHLV
ncbi:MAG: hypothetical protein RLZZ553_480 [Verrucomicrobiota bacterium]